MVPLYSILAANGLEFVPLIVFAVSAIVLAISVVVGCIKGFRKVSWAGLFWLLSCVAFLFVNANFRDSNPILSLPIVEKLKPDVQNFVSSVSIMLVCIIVVLILQGLFTFWFKPAVRHVKTKKYRERDIDADGYICDTDTWDEYDDDNGMENDYVSFVVPVRNYVKPSIIGRVFGAICCFINTFAIICGVLAAVLLFVNISGLQEGILQDLYALEIVDKALGVTLEYGLDFLIIGVIYSIAARGFKNGLLESARSLLVSVGGIALIGVCFYLPFSAYAVEGGALELLYDFAQSSATLFSDVTEEIADLIGRAIVGVTLSVIAAVILIIVNWLLKKLVDFLCNISTVRVLDGMLASLVYSIIGISVCLSIYVVLYFLSYIGMFTPDYLFAQSSSISKGMFDVLELWLAPMLG